MALQYIYLPKNTSNHLKHLEYANDEYERRFVKWETYLCRKDCNFPFVDILIDIGETNLANS